MKFLLLSPGQCDSPVTWSGTSKNILEGFYRIVGKDKVAYINMYSFIPRVLKAFVILYSKVFFVGGNKTRNRFVFPLFAKKCRKFICKENPKGWNLFIADHAASLLPDSVLSAVYIDSDYLVWAPNVDGICKDSYLRYFEKKTGASFRKMNLIFTMNEWTRDYTIKHYGLPESKVFNVGFGINVKLYYGNKNYSEKRMLIVLRKGREKMKGLVLLLNALKIARQTYPDLSLDVVGTDYGNGEENVRCWYNFPRSKTTELFQKASLYVMPSQGEPNGITYLEALANKAPIVGLKGFAVPEFSGYGKYGFVIDEVSPDAVARTIVEAFSDVERLKKMGEDGQAFVADRFSWDNVTNQMYNIMINHK